MDKYAIHRYCSFVNNVKEDQSYVLTDEIQNQSYVLTDENQNQSKLIPDFQYQHVFLLH